MPCRNAKSILGLLVLLVSPFSGLANRAEGSFVLRKPGPEAESPLPTAWPEVATGCVCCGIDLTPCTPLQNAAEPTTPSRETDIPARDSRLAFSFRQAYTDLQHGGMTAPDSSTVAGVGSSLYLLHSESSPPHANEVSGCLFLADDRYQLPPFPSRLFRPPRGHV